VQWDEELGMDKIDVSALSFEEGLERLEVLVETIDAGDLALAEAIDTFKLAMALSEHCAKLLEEAEAAIEELVTAADDREGSEEEAEGVVADIEEGNGEGNEDGESSNPFGDE
jgi:exodeoxyribonuclease VII small subunit